MITKREVEQIAELARIGLTLKEKTRFEKDLSGILDFVARLNEVDTADVEPLSGGTDLENVMREDVGKPQVSNSRARELLKQAPKERGGFVEVKAVFERE